MSVSSKFKSGDQLELQEKLKSPGNTSPASGFLRLYQIVGDVKRGIKPLIPVSRSTWWLWVSTGRAPKPIKLGPKTTVWRGQDIYEFIRNAI
jgi:prophage regulatory protein